MSPLLTLPLALLLSSWESLLSLRLLELLLEFTLLISALLDGVDCAGGLP